MTRTYSKLTPNLIVDNVERSLAFYVDVLGFTRGFTVPGEPPLVFASVSSGSVEIFFNDKAAAVHEYPTFGGKPLGLTGTLYVETSGIEEWYERLKAKAPIVMALVTQFYGAKEFAIADPDGYVITFAERGPADPASA
jgi:lactoylglutathione lyase